MIAAESAEQRVVSKLLNDGTLTTVGLTAMLRESELMGLPIVEGLQAHDVVSEVEDTHNYEDLSRFWNLDLSRRKS